MTQIQDLMFVTRIDKNFRDIQSVYAPVHTQICFIILFTL